MSLVVNLNVTKLVYLIFMSVIPDIKLILEHFVFYFIKQDFHLFLIYKFNEIDSFCQDIVQQRIKHGIALKRLTLTHKSQHLYNCNSKII